MVLIRLRFSDPVLETLAGALHERGCIDHLREGGRDATVIERAEIDANAGASDAVARRVSRLP
jgi:hypothetical protein